METGFMPIFWRDMVKFNRLKIMLFVSLIQPIIWLALFGVSMASNMEGSMPDTGQAAEDAVGYLTFMAPGIIAMTVLFTCLYSSMFLQLDRQYGILKTMVASPLPRSQILVGLSLSGVVKSLIQVVIIILFGFLLGVRLFDGMDAGEVLMGFLGILLFTVVFAAGLMFLSCMIAISIESHEGVQGVITMLTLPLFFLSNALYSLETLPRALEIASLLNPMTHFIIGVRYFGIGDTFSALGTEYAYSGMDLGASMLYLVVIAILLFVGALKAMRKASVV